MLPLCLTDPFKPIPHSSKVEKKSKFLRTRLTLQSQLNSQKRSLSLLKPLKFSDRILQCVKDFNPMDRLWFIIADSNRRAWPGIGQQTENNTKWNRRLIRKALPTVLVLLHFDLITNDRRTDYRRCHDSVDTQIKHAASQKATGECQILQGEWWKQRMN